MDSCPICNLIYTKDNWRSGHHILPKRFFKGEGGIYYLCRSCHNLLELFIPQDTKLSVKEYKQILRNFISVFGQSKKIAV